MKNFFKLIFLFVAFISITACGGDDNNDTPGIVSALAATPTSISATADGGTFTIAVSGASREWKAYTGNDWIKVSTTGTTAQSGSVSVVVSANNDTAARNGEVSITSGTDRIAVSVAQAGKAPDPEPTPDPTSDSIVVPDGYKLVWHDEFNGDKLSSDWTHEVQGPGWVNNELQSYVNNDRVTSVADGMLSITCYKDNSGRICSGRIYARPTTGWTYGWFEARIKLPQGKGTWPAWWMMPSNNDYGKNPWPGCGEIDIMEEVGADANQVTSTIHCNRYNNGNTATEHGVLNVPTAESDYHVYACEWTESKLEFFVDGKSILKYQPSDKGKDYWPFNVPFYPILNLAWGGSWGGYKGVDENALPATMKVDYVRIFQKK